MAPKDDRLLPWVEKHRPATIADVAHQEEVVNALRTTLESSSYNLPHLLFYGPPGTGKTSIISAVTKQLFGPLHKERTLELNASDERGINVIRQRVKTFAQTSVGNQTVEGFPCPPFKVIILDEADSMTGDAQAALRRVMENYAKMTRFCLICNYITKIIEPLASRCSKFRFQPIAEAAHLRKLRDVCAAENVTVEAGALEELCRVAEGDLRRSITLLQSTSLLHSGSVSQSSIREVAGSVPPELVTALLAALRAPDGAAVFQRLQAAEAEGYGAQILAPLLDLIVAEPGIADIKKAQCAKALGTVDARLADGVDEDLQLRWVCAEMHAALQPVPAA